MLNKVQIIGRVGKTPEIQDVNGTKKAKFSIASTEKYRNKQGEKVEETEWFNIIFWGARAEVVEKFVNVGDLLYIEGKLKTTKNEANGETKYYTFVNGLSLQMLGSKGEKQPQTTEAQPSEDEEDLPF